MLKNLFSRFSQKNSIPDFATQPPDTFSIGTDSRERPVYIPYEFDESFYWFLGATRSGKTSMGLYPFLKQRIERNDAPVVVCDLKGEPWFFHAIKDIAEKEGRTFRWFTNVPEFSTYLFNPLNQSSFDKLLLYQFAQVLCNALDLYHGPGYGRGYFNMKSRRLLTEALYFRSTGDPRNAWMPTEESKKVRSFSQLLERVRSLATNRQEREDAEHLVGVLEDLARILQVDCILDGKPLPDEAVSHAIHVPDILVPDANGRFPVLFFFLRSGSELVGVPHITKILMYCILTTRIDAQDNFMLGRRADPPPNVSVGIDEWTAIADDSVRVMIEQASGLGVHFAFANQDVSQLRKPDSDLQSTLWENAGSKICFTSRDVKFQDQLMKVCGEKKQYVPAYTVSHPAFKQGKVTPENALHVLNGQWAPIQIREETVPRISRDDLIRMSVSPSQCLYVPPFSSQRTGLDGYPMVLNGRYHMSESDFKSLKRRPWPMDAPGTIVPAELLKQDK